MRPHHRIDLCLDRCPDRTFLKEMGFDEILGGCGLSSSRSIRSQPDEW
jgi:hypothetical protein